MWKPTPLSSVTAISAIGLLSLAIASTNVIAQDYEGESAYRAELPAADVMVSGEFIDFMPQVEFERAVVRIAGPEGYSATVRIPAGTDAITADLLLDAHPAPTEDINRDVYASESDRSWHTLPDGKYRYELVMTASNEVIAVENGHFFVENGVAVDNSESNETSSTTSPNFIQRLAGAALDILVPQAHAQDLEGSHLELSNTQGGGPRISWDHDDDGSIEWWTFANKDRFLISDRTTHSGTPQTIRFDTGIPQNSLRISESSGRIQVGLGTGSPQEHLHIVNHLGNATRIKLENQENSYKLSTGEFTGFAIEQEDPVSRTPFRIEPDAPSNSIHVDSGGFVGIGTGSPDAQLHLEGSGGFKGPPAIRLADGGEFFEWNYNTSATTGFLNLRSDEDNTLLVVRKSGGFGVDATPAESDILRAGSLRVKDDGNVGVGEPSPDTRFHLTGGSGGVAMATFEREDFPARIDFTTPGGNPQFRFNRSSNIWAVGTQSDRFAITASDVVGTDNLVEVYENGNMWIAGSLTQNSSRQVKHDISEVDSSDVLSRLDSLKISKWSYDHNPDAKHVGPMAEDWHEVFGLGANKRGVSLGDLASISLAAVKGLKAENEILKQRLEKLETSLQEK